MITSMKSQLFLLIRFFILYLLVTIVVKYAMVGFDPYTHAIWRYSYLGTQFPKTEYQQLVLDYPVFVLKNGIIQLALLCLFMLVLIALLKNRVKWFGYVIFFIMAELVTKWKYLAFDNTHLLHVYPFNREQYQFNKFLYINTVFFVLMIIIAIVVNTIMNRRQWKIRFNQ